jgi:hypothetical protein
MGRIDGPIVAERLLFREAKQGLGVQGAGLEVRQVAITDLSLLNPEP